MERQKRWEHKNPPKKTGDEKKRGKQKHETLKKQKNRNKKEQKKRGRTKQTQK